MAELKNRQDVFKLASSMRMQLSHFAAGEYPIHPLHPAMHPKNRFFLIENNPDGDACYIEDANERCILKTGYAYLIPAFHATRWILSERLRFISIHFTLETMEGIDIFSSAKRIFQCSNPIYYSMASRIWQERKTFSAAAGLKMICYQLCADLFQNFTDDDFNAVNRFLPYQKVLDFIHEKGNAKTSVAELAELMEMRQDTFSKKFTAKTGISPKAFLNNFLIRKAEELLCHQNSVHKTSELLGFNNEFYFSHFFKKLTGYAPSSYQKLFSDVF